MTEPKTSKTTTYLAATGLLAAAGLTLTAPFVAVPLAALVAAPVVLGADRRHNLGKLKNDLKDFAQDLQAHVKSDAAYVGAKLKELRHWGAEKYQARKEEAAARKADAAPAPASTFDADASSKNAFDHKAGPEQQPPVANDAVKPAETPKPQAGNGG